MTLISKTNTRLLLMMETSTSVNKLNYTQPDQEEVIPVDVETHDLMFYENIKSQLDALSRNPSDEAISRILAYSRAK